MQRGQGRDEQEATTTVFRYLLAQATPSHGSGRGRVAGGHSGAESTIVITIRHGLSTVRPTTFERYVQLPAGAIACVVAVLLAWTWSDPVAGVLVGAIGLGAIGNALDYWSDGVLFASASLLAGAFAVWIGVGAVPIDERFAVVFGVLAVATAVRAYLFYTGYFERTLARPE